LPASTTCLAAKAAPRSFFSSKSKPSVAPGTSTRPSIRASCCGEVDMLGS
jgi:hypothetical protein